MEGVDPAVRSMVGMYLENYMQRTPYSVSNSNNQRLLAPALKLHHALQTMAPEWSLIYIV